MMNIGLVQAQHAPGPGCIVRMSPASCDECKRVVQCAKVEGCKAAIRRIVATGEFEEIDGRKLMFYFAPDGHFCDNSKDIVHICPPDEDITQFLGDHMLEGNPF